MTNRNISRRELLQATGLGFGQLALTYLLHAPGLDASEAHSSVPVFNDLRPRRPHFPGKAKAVIQLMQNGGPSQMDLFDPKPELTKRSGQPHPHGVETFQAGITTSSWPALSSSSTTESAARRWRRCCRTWAASLTTFVWCAPCIASITIIRKV